jgi:ABC-type bacteriocin/lantibiotic exporter with double-glycine peptidase domain
MIKTLFSISFNLLKFLNSKLLFYVAFVVYIFDAFLLLILPLVSAWLIDALALYDRSDFNKYLYILIAVSIFRIITNYFANLLTVKITEEFGYNLRRTIINNILNLGFIDFEKKSLGDYTSRLFNDSSKLKGFFTSFVLSLSIDILFLLALAVILIKMNLFLSIILFVFIPFTIYYGLIFKNRINFYSKETQEKLALLTNKVYSWFMAFLFIKAYNLNKTAEAQYAYSDSSYIKATIGQGFFHSLVSASNVLVLSIPSVLIFFLGGVQYFDGKLSIGVLFAFISYSTYFNVPLQRVISSLIIELPKLVPIFNRIKPYIDIYKNIANENEIPLRNTEYDDDIITIKEIKHTFGASFNLKINNLKLHRGHLIGLSGPNGSGKSTIAKILSGSIQTRCITLLKDKDFDSFSANVFYFSQNQVLFDGSLVENITLFEKKPNLTKINEIANYLNLFDILKINVLDNYIFDFSNKSSFSSGQIQKIALARLLYTKKEILILDEPETSLDNENRTLLSKWLSLQTDKFILLISHNDKLLELCNQVYELHRYNSSFTLKHLKSWNKI